VTLRAISAVATLLAGPPLLDRSKGRRQTKRDTKTDAGSSVISSGLKHGANVAQDVSSSYSNRCVQSGLNDCCTAMGKANGKTTTLSLFVDSLFPKTEISYMRDASSGDKKKLSFEGGSSRSHYVEESFWRRLWTCRQTEY